MDSDDTKRDRHVATAMGYAWGYADGANDGHPSSPPFDVMTFANAYADARMSRGGCPSVQDAHRRFLATGGVK